MKHEAKLRELAAFFIRNISADNPTGQLREAYALQTKERVNRIYGVSTTQLVARVNFTCGGRQKIVNFRIYDFDKAADVAEYLNQSLNRLGDFVSKKVFEGNEPVTGAEIIYKGKKPIAVISYEKEVNLELFKRLRKVSQFQFPTESNYTAELLLPDSEHDALTHPLNEAVITAQPYAENVAGYFHKNLRALGLNREELKYYFEGVIAKSLLGKLPHYSLRNRYNFGTKDEAVFGAFSVTHGIANYGNLLFAQVRKLDGMLGHLGGFGRLDPSSKDEKTGEIIKAEPEQPIKTVKRETKEEAKKFGEILHGTKLQLINTSIFPRPNAASDIAFGFDRVVPELVMKEVIANVAATRLSKKRSEEVAASSGDEVHSLLVMPVSVALALRHHFAYPHESKADEIIAKKLGIEQAAISDCAKNTLAEIDESDSKLKNLHVIVERMALEKVVEVLTSGASEKDAEIEFSNAIEKFGRAVLSLIKPNTYDINTNLPAIHEIEDYMANGLPDKLATKLGLEEFKKKACFNEIIADYESSDIVYARIPQDELLALYAKLKQAFDLYHISYLTQETTKHDRVFLHAALNMVGAKIGVEGIFEYERGVNFEQEGLPLYEAHRAEYDEWIQDESANLRDELEFFEGELRNFDDWQADGLGFPYDEALKKYRLGKERITNGLYEPEYDGELEDLVRKWIKLKVEHKHHLEKAYALLEEKIVVSENALVPQIESGLENLMEAGGMASGKTYRTIEILRQRGIKITSVTLNDTDHLGRSLARAAMKDNVVKKPLDDPNHNWGTRMHYEAANVRYELTNLLAKLAKAGKRPNVVINMLSPGSFEIEMAITGGAKLHVELLTIGIDQAWEDVNKRANQAGNMATNRLPPVADFRRSHRNANLGLLRLVPYKGHNITADLLERVGTDFGTAYAHYNAKDNSLVINDINAFTRMAQRAYQTGNATKDLSTYFEKLVTSGVKISFNEVDKEVVRQLKSRIEADRSIHL